MKEEGFFTWTSIENACKGAGDLIGDRVSTIDDKIEKYNQKIEKLNKKIKELEKGKPLYKVGDRVILAPSHDVVRIKKVKYDKKLGYTYYFKYEYMTEEKWVFEKDILKHYAGDSDYINYLLHELWRVERILDGITKGND